MQTKRTLVGIQKELIKAKHKLNANGSVIPAAPMTTPMKSLMIRSSRSASPEPRIPNEENQELKSKIESQKRHYKEKVRKLKADMEAAKQAHSHLLVQVGEFVSEVNCID